MQEISANNVEQATDDQQVEVAGKAATTITFEDFQDMAAPEQAREDLDQVEPDEDEAFHSEFVKQMKQKIKDEEIQTSFANQANELLINDDEDKFM